MLKKHREIKKIYHIILTQRETILNVANLKTLFWNNNVILGRI